MEQEIQYSEREHQVIELLMQGRSTKQIVLRTVEFHLSNIDAKLGVPAARASTQFARQQDSRLLYP